MFFMTLREDKFGQTWLIPLKLSDLIPEEHICNFVANLVNELDFREVEGKYRHTPGKPAYSRKMLLRPVLMASIDGVFSSRKIAKLIRENVVYIHLAGTETLDFRTICSFKNECKDLIEEAFKMTVKIAKKRGIAKFNHISPDGTIIKANANNNNSLTKKRIRNH